VVESLVMVVKVENGDVVFLINKFNKIFISYIKVRFHLLPINK